MAKRVEFHWKSDFKNPSSDGYKIKNNVIYGYISKIIGEKEFNDLVFIAPIDELKAIVISDIVKGDKEDK